MIKWIFPRPGDSFVGWIGRVTLICTITFIILGTFGLIMNKYYQDDTIVTDYEWIGLDPNRPVSDISHRDWKTGQVYYREYGPFENRIQNPSNSNLDIRVNGRQVSIEDLFIDYQLENDYEYLYEMFRD
ncbi:MAG: hypothetical protein LBU83_09955 [Bacteroidales bacterium]|jgi:hypothetical protein|nr:hypothetical protein [Bacteroidales bacterium]